MACRFTPNPQQLIEHKHLGTTLRKAVAKAESGEGASVFGYYVDDPITPEILRKLVEGLR